MKITLAEEDAPLSNALWDQIDSDWIERASLTFSGIAISDTTRRQATPISYAGFLEIDRRFRARPGAMVVLIPSGTGYLERQYYAPTEEYTGMAATNRLRLAITRVIGEAAWKRARIEPYGRNSTTSTAGN